jgi:hypothetical protein
MNDRLRLAVLGTGYLGVTQRAGRLAIKAAFVCAVTAADRWHPLRSGLTISWRPQHPSKRSSA